MTIEQAFQWETQQFTEFLVYVGGRASQPDAALATLEQALEALDGEVGVILDHGKVRLQFGFGRREVPASFVDAVRRHSVTTELFGQQLQLVQARLAEKGPLAHVHLVIGRRGDPLTGPEIQLAHSMALMVGLVLENHRALEEQQQRGRLLESLLDIQRQISAKRPLQALLDAITAGASEVLGGRPVTLLLTDPHDLEALVARSTAPAGTPSWLGSGTGVVDRTVLADRADGEWVHAAVLVTGSEVGYLVAPIDETASDLSFWGPDDAKDVDLLDAFAQQVGHALTDAETLSLFEQAHTDSVTGLPNRSYFLYRAPALLHDAADSDPEAVPVVLFIDLDGFKAVNDTFGHAVGDALLAQVGARIAGALPSAGLLGRVGGDEFAVVLPRAGIVAGMRAAHRIIDRIGRVMVVDGHEVVVGASVGVVGGTAGSEISALIAHADIAMYRAKRSGGNRAEVFEPAMQTEVARRLTLRTDLRHAVDSGQLRLHYQPIVTLADNTVNRMEALIRWEHPERGLLQPQSFIPLAEESGVIRPLGAWVIQQSVRELAVLRRTHPDFTLSVNASVHQIFEPEFADVLSESLAVNNVPGSAVTMEITESILIADPANAREQLGQLSSLGCQISLDDFGTGYSSLSYLRDFQVNEVKLDRSFISGINDNASTSVVLITALLGLCRRLGISTVGEGIENRLQLDTLFDLGCHYGQGYLFSRPLSLPDLRRWLVNRPS